MQIIAHRGFWRTEAEKNTIVSFERAFSNGFGIETDIRDQNGRIVISHNPPDKNAPMLTEMLDIWSDSGRKSLLALNIKADGLYLLIEEIFKKYNIKKENYFFFDSSLPEQYIYIKRGYNIFTRSSEFEEKICFWKESSGVWLDQFTDCSHIIDTLPNMINSGKLVSVVSPELHKRNKEKIWDMLKKYKECKNLILCTDAPKEAEEYFK